MASVYRAASNMFSIAGAATVPGIVARAGMAVLGMTGREVAPQLATPHANMEVCEGEAGRGTIVV